MHYIHFLYLVYFSPSLLQQNWRFFYVPQVQIWHWTQKIRSWQTLQKCFCLSWRLLPVKLSILIEDFEHEPPKVISELVDLLDGISELLLYYDSSHVESVNVLKRSKSVEVTRYEKKKA